MSIDQIILEEIKVKCSELNQSNEFTDLLIKWLSDMSEDQLEESEMMIRLDLLIEKIKNQN